MYKLFSINPILPKSGLTVIRIIVGLFLIYHGWEVFDKNKINEYITWDVFKRSSSPSLMVYIGKTSELVGGFLLLTGLFTRLACVIIILTFLYISFFVGHGKIWYEDQYPFLFVLLALVFFFTGPGILSIDQFILMRTNQNKK
jgi:putative oxidoreductase